MPIAPSGVTERPIAFERATDLAARQLARARSGFEDLDAEPTENDRLLAGHIVGNLWANDLLNTGDEEWVPVNRHDDLKEIT